ncbi:MAG: methyl-accepting chemotaxis protein [Candidatus Schekmanbacteria bacterium]|nr:MAG: methyl-accepting chemotaxis protein [Candidatus Schekmanbacteria bacterium]
MKGNKRKKVLVDKVAQTKYAVAVVLYLIIYTVIISFLIYLPTITVLSEKTAPLEKKIEAANQFFFLEKRYLPVVLLVMIAMALHSVTITHKFFGPIFRFKEAARSIAEGKMAERVLRRKNDYLKDFEVEFNNMVNALNMRFLEISNLTLKNYKIIEELKNAKESEITKERISQKLEELKSNLEEVERLVIKKR